MYRYIFCAIFFADGMKTQIPESMRSLKNPPTQVTWVSVLDFLRAPWRYAMKSQSSISGLAEDWLGRSGPFTRTNSRYSGGLGRWQMSPPRIMTLDGDLKLRQAMSLLLDHLDKGFEDPSASYTPSSALSLTVSPTTTCAVRVDACNRSSWFVH